MVMFAIRKPLAPERADPRRKARLQQRLRLLRNVENGRADPFQSASSSLKGELIQQVLI